MARTPAPQDQALARQARLVGIVLVGTMAAWLLAQEIGHQYGWDARYAFLFDLAAGAAFVWALAVTYRIWRKRRD
jgi:hypothetical protein